MKSFVEQPADVSPEILGRHMLKFFISATESGIGDILAHPFFPYGFTDIYDAALLTISDAELFDTCSIVSSKNVGIEINPCYFPDENKKRFFSIETPVRFLSIAKEAGCKFTFGSDAHCIGDFSLLERLQYFVNVLKIQETDIHTLAKTESCS